MAGDGDKRLRVPEESDGEAAERASDEYLQKIIQEIEKRLNRVASLEEEERRLEFELGKHSVTRSAMRGSAFALRTAESYNRSLRSELQKIRAALVDAREDLERAQERKRIHERELADLERSEEGN